MRQLDVSPLPCMEAADDRPRVPRPLDGFVEESVVVALLTASDSRQGVRQHWPVMEHQADALDYAGWPPGEPVTDCWARAV